MLIVMRVRGFELMTLLTVFAALAPLPALAAIHLGDPNTAPLSNGLVGYWTFDGAVTNWATGQTQDISGNGNTGQLVNMSTSTSPVAGKIGQALTFDGSSSYVSTATNQGNGSSLQTITLSVWFKTTAAIGNKIVGLEDTQTGTGSSAYDREIYIGSNGKVYGYVYDGGEEYVTSTATYTDGKWHHAVVTIAVNSAMKLYVDGILQQATPIGVPCSTYPTSYWRIGSYLEAHGNGASGYFNGTIDDVRIYNRALSATEVKQLYTLGAANIGHSNTVALANGLVGYCTMDGSSINWATGQMTDVSGSGNTGQLISMSTSSSPVAGKVGQALNFDGSSSAVSLGDVAPLKITGRYTLSGWFQSNSPASTQTIVGKTHTGMSGYFIGLYGGLAFVQNNGVWTDVGNVVSDTKWHHMVGTYDGTNLRIYLDGVLHSM